ncbi:MAG: intradiol ring-cleavage dioxygenase [Bauldia sp.]
MNTGLNTALTRRRALTMLAVTVGGSIVLPRTLLAQASSLLLPGIDVCTLVPEVTEGPYYFDPTLVRADITEGKDGLPLTLRMQVVDAACAPIENARVDIWHCDAAGVYSGYANQTAGVDTTGQTFLRGTLFTDARGLVEFSTIYPGWYVGRTTHIHFKVFLDESNVLTGQIFFDEAVNAAVYASVPAYARSTTRTLFNDNDGIAQQAGAASIAAVDQTAATYVAALIVGVDPNATSAGGAMGPGGMPPGGPPR